MPVVDADGDDEDPDTGDSGSAPGDGLPGPGALGALIALLTVGGALARERGRGP